ncbi:CBS domain-containing protein [Cryptosporangium japonicum]|uniref:CBS domain-containing protein n=1 Tax=Cryptosporangium japonicum TaxID=80872 RepID=A0ABN0TJE4_9ACTN
MTTDVVTVGLDTPAKVIAQLLDTRHVNALPVLNEQRTVVGVVSEQDLLHKITYADLADAETEGWTRLLSRHHDAKAKSRASVARDLMTSPAVTVLPDATIVEAAKRMERHGVKTLPVVDGVGELVGIVTRRDLVGVLLRPDQQIHDEIVHEVFGEALLVNAPDLAVEVTEGVVTLRGTLDRLTQTTVAAGLVKRVDGVVHVNNELGHRTDDTVYVGM